MTNIPGEWGVQSFSDTRARTSDPQTSKDAAKAAARDKARLQRMVLAETVQHFYSATAKDLSEFLQIDLADVYRRLPECAGIKPHETMRRDGCRVWVKA